MNDRSWKKGILVASVQAGFLISIRESTTLCNIQTSSCIYIYINVIYIIVIFIVHFFQIFLIAGIMFMFQSVQTT